MWWVTGWVSSPEIAKRVIRAVALDDLRWSRWSSFAVDTYKLAQANLGDAAVNYMILLISQLLQKLLTADVKLPSPNTPASLACSQLVPLTDFLNGLIDNLPDDFGEDVVVELEVIAILLNANARSPSEVFEALDELKKHSSDTGAGLAHIFANLALGKQIADIARLSAASREHESAIFKAIKSVQAMTEASTAADFVFAETS